MVILQKIINYCGAIIDHIYHAPLFWEEKDRETKNALNNVLINVFEGNYNVEYV